MCVLRWRPHRQESVHRCFLIYHGLASWSTHNIYHRLKTYVIRLISWVSWLSSTACYACQGIFWWSGLTGSSGLCHRPATRERIWLHWPQERAEFQLPWAWGCSSVYSTCLAYWKTLSDLQHHKLKTKRQALCLQSMHCFHTIQKLKRGSLSQPELGTVCIYFFKYTMILLTFLLAEWLVHSGLLRTFLILKPKVPCLGKTLNLSERGWLGMYPSRGFMKFLHVLWGQGLHFLDPTTRNRCSSMLESPSPSGSGDEVCWPHHHHHPHTLPVVALKWKPHI